MGIKSASDFDGATEGRAQEVPPVAPSHSDPHNSDSCPACILARERFPSHRFNFTLECKADGACADMLSRWLESGEGFEVELTRVTKERVTERVRAIGVLPRFATYLVNQRLSS